MDELDIAIIRSLFGTTNTLPLSPDPRPSFSAMARKLKVDEVTIRNRVRKMESTGVLKGRTLQLNPGLVGLTAASLLIDVLPPSSKADVIKKLLLMQGVLAVLSNIGNSLGIIILYESERGLRNQVELITRIASSENVVSVNIPLPRPQVRLSPADLKLIRIIQKDPNKSYLSVAEELGLSNKTVKLRLAKLIEGNAMFFLPNIEVKALRGLTVVGLLVFYDGVEMKQAVDDAIASHMPDNLARAELGSREHAYFDFLIPNVVIAQELLEWTKHLRGVRSAHVGLLQERFDSSEPVDEVLRRLELQVTSVQGTSRKQLSS